MRPLLFFRSLSLPVRALAALTTLVSASGCVTVQLEDPNADSAYPDGGVDDAPEVVRVDCCEIETAVARSLCDDLYLGTEPPGVVILDTCNEAEPEGEPEEEAEEEPQEETEGAPCAGLEGLEAIVCEVGTVLAPGANQPQSTDPCAGLEGIEAALCQAGNAFGFAAAPTNAATNPLTELVGDLAALGELASGLDALGELFGLNDEAG